MIPRVPKGASTPGRGSHVLPSVSLTISYTGCRWETNFKNGYCCQTYVPFSDDDRQTSRDLPNPGPSSIISTAFEASSRWVLHTETVNSRRCSSVLSLALQTL